MPKCYVCRKCGRIHSQLAYDEGRFCKNCGTFLYNTFVENKAREQSLPKEVTKRYCRDYGISTLYHITPMENTLSIMEHGLFCYNLTEDQNLLETSCSNHEIQERRSQSFVGDRSANDYVPLFFSEKSPMLYAIEYSKEHMGKKIIYICIKGEIIGEKGVWFSDGNVASNQTIRYYSLGDLRKLDWDLIRAFNQDKYGFEEAKRIKSAEVLIPSVIEPRWFEKLIVPSLEAKLKLQPMLPQPMLPIEIKPEFYFNPAGYSSC